MMINGRVVPPAYVGSCGYCGEPIDTRSPATHVRIKAWMPCGIANATGRSRVALIEQTNSYACEGCYGRLVDGIPPTQMSIFDALRERDGT